jgi:hypothetical protein
MSPIPRNVGFDGRMFLDEAEWHTYCRRKAVRYIRRPRAAVCQVCGLPGSSENPLQSAHIIGFDVGVIDLGMTPDFLDSDKNIVTAHRRTCNRSSELDLQGSMSRLRDLGVQELPKYLPAPLQEAWGKAPEAMSQTCLGKGKRGNQDDEDDGGD